MLSNLSKEDDETKTKRNYAKRENRLEAMPLRRFKTLRHKDLQEYGHSASRTGPV
jgi:hypothetical protein